MHPESQYTIRARDTLSMLTGSVGAASACTETAPSSAQEVLAMASTYFER